MVQVLVLDEVDILINKQNFEFVSRIMGQMVYKQLVMTTATITQEETSKIQSFCPSLRIFNSYDENVLNTQILNQFLIMPRVMKKYYLFNFLNKRRGSGIIVFFKKCKQAYKFY